MSARREDPGWTPAAAVTLRAGLVLLEAPVEDFDVRAAVVLGQDAALVWDTLAHPHQMTPASDLVAGRRVCVAYSHADWDHVWGTGALGLPAEVVGHDACAARFRTDVRSELEERRSRDPDRWGAVTLVPPTRTFEDRAQVDLGGMAVELHHLPGHTPDCCVAWIPDWGLLLAGDTVETPLPVVNDPSAVRSWAADLRRWERAGGLAAVVPAHGTVGGPEVIASTAAYLEGLLQARAPAPARALSPFYRNTHRRNLALFGLA